MVERKVHPVPDIVTDDLPEVPVHHLRISTESNGPDDAFARPASDLKALNGTNAVFKRRVTNELKKQFSGVGGAQTQQIEPEAEPTMTGYQIFDVVLPLYNLDYLAKLYELSPIHYAAVNAKVANIVGLGYKLTETTMIKRMFEENAGNERKVKKARQQLEQHRDDLMATLESFNTEDTVIEILTKVWRDYEVIGNGYLEVGRKRDGSIGYIGHIPAQTMRIRKKRDGFVQISGYRVQFFRNFGDVTTANPIGGGRPNEIIHIKRYSPTSGFYGIPDVVAAKQAIAGNEFAARFNLEYFENKAVPRHVVILKGAKLGSAAENALLSFFETGLKGQSHRSLFIPLPAGDRENPVDFKIEKVESGVQDASFVNYRKANLSDILMAHRVPVSKIGLAEGVSLAASRDADKTFKEQVCAPEQKIFEKKFNRIIRELTDSLEFKLNEMTLTDADTQSKIDERMVKAGIWLPNEPRTRDGMPTISGGDERVDLNAKDKISQQQQEATTQRERDSVRSAGATDSAGEGRNTQGEGRTAP